MTGRARILVVEDVLPLRTVLEVALDEAGYEVICAAEDGEALRECAQQPFDIVVLDADLLHTDGFELAARLRAAQEGRSFSVIFMTSRREADLPARATAAGGVGLLLKPFWLCELLQAVAHCLPEHPAGPPVLPARWPQVGLANDPPAAGLVSPAMKDQPLALLEERLAWLQRHVAEQDKVMLELAGEIDRLKKQMAELRGKLTTDSGESGDAGERPPHY
ncbi:MAG: SlyX family protein [Opitutaceae bacterium]|nr:SlyX family protein [Opitutaceae bacterium]